VRGGSVLVYNSRTAVSLFYASTKQQKRGAGSVDARLVLEHKKPTSSVLPKTRSSSSAARRPFGAVLRLPTRARPSRTRSVGLLELP